MDKLIKLVEGTLMPLNKYVETPDLTNLNKLGSFLKLDIEPKT